VNATAKVVSLLEEAIKSDRMLTQAEARRIAVDAALEALARFAAAHPLPTQVTAKEAARMLGVSGRTISRMRLPRNSAGKIPYEAVLEARAAS
jgi:hypothetical protein